MNPLDPSPQGPAGSLEELFRHHLLESTAATVPPRPFVWEQLDNSLLLQQNEQYRRRLRTYRWAMAASLLLTLLAGGGWWHSQLGRPGLAADRSPAPAAGPAAASADRLAGAAATNNSPSSLTNHAAIEQTTTLFSSSSPTSALGFASLGAASLARHDLSTTNGLAYGYAADKQLVAALAATAPAGSPDRLAAAGRARRSAADEPALALLASAAGQLAAQPAPDGTDGFLPDAALSTSEDAPRARLASLRLSPAATTLPAELPAGPVVHLTQVPRSTGPWTLQVAYASGMYDPNIDFTKSPDSYNANLGPGTVATTRDAAAEYRHNLRAGLSQRLGVWATRRLGIGRWSVRTGLEASQSEAGSASSVAFVGEQVSTLNSYVQVLPNRTTPTYFRYRAVSVPVEAAYRRPLRRNLSLYGRAGALLSALLNVQSEVTGDPTADRSYSLRSVGSPYRHLSASVRGGAGLRYQPTGQAWAFSLGPVAETGIMSLNIDPSQTFWHQQRPYSVGLEAGVEFGSWLKPAPTPLP